MSNKGSVRPERTGDTTRAGPSEYPRTGAATSISGLEDAPINILIVDDEPKNLTVLESVLADPSYRLVRSASAEEALLALIVDEFALLILDIQMPGMTGFELAQMIKKRKRTAHVPIIFLTAYYNEDQDVLEGYGAGAVDYLQKPVNPAVLRSKVSVFAELYRKDREVGIANRALLAEVAHRRRIEEQLRELNETLEQRVTERTDALRENEARLRHAADAARLTYVEEDFMRGEVRTAENFATVMGYASPPEKHADFSKGTRLLLEHVVPEDRRLVATALREVAGGKPVAKLDYRVLGDDRIERWIESEWFAEIDPDGKPLKNFLTNLDITDRKAAQEQLRESEERFRQLADSMPQMVWTARRNGFLDYYNARWYESMGLGTEWQGDLANWSPILHPDDVKQCCDAWYGSVQRGEAHRTESRLWDGRAMRYCWHLIRALPIRDKNGDIVKWIGTCTDIDEQKRSEEYLRRANQALEQFAFAASHDLQEPLRNVAIFSELFKQRCGANLSEEGNMFLGTIVEGAQRMSHLVSDLLKYAQIAGLDGEPATNVDGEEIFEQVLKTLHQAMLESHATITHDTLPSVPIKGVHLEQLLQNLIGNALKYRAENEPPRVHVSALHQGGQWQFVVQDNGIGIGHEYREKIFGVFKRLHAAGDRYSGTGIGLAICRKIVESYGGRIWVESELGHGAAFHFTIPDKPVDTMLRFGN
jgi:PAS domain S-box-containing protein